MNRRLATLALIGLAVGVVVTLVLVLGGNDDDNGPSVAAAGMTATAAAGGTTGTATPDTTDTPEPTATAEGTPEATPGPETRAREFALSPVVEPDLTFIQGGIEDVPEGTGVYVLDIETGELVGWHASEDLYAGPRFYLAPDNRIAVGEYGVTASPERRVVADIASGNVYEWSAEAEPVTGPQDGVAAAGGRVLFRLPIIDGPDWYAVVDLDAGASTVSAFEVEAQAAWLSSDGTRVVTVGDEVQAFDVTSGTLQWSEDHEISEPDQACQQYVDQLAQQGFENATARRFTLSNTSAADGILIKAHPACVGPDSQEHWRHYAWDGELLAQGTGNIRASPNGDYAWVGSTPQEELPIAEAIDLETGEPHLRVVGAAPSGDYPVVLMPGDGGADNWGSVTLEDGIQSLPIEGATSVYPAPGNEAVFAERALDLYIRAFDLEGNQLGGFTPDPGTTLQGASFAMSPWGSVPGELRFVASARGSDDCCPTWSLVSPYVEVPPYEADLPVVRLRPEAEGIGVRDSAAGETIIGQLSGLEVQLLGSMRVNTQAGEPANELHCAFLAEMSGEEPSCQAPQSGLWLNVLTPAGTEGWILVEARVNAL